MRKNTFLPILTLVILCVASTRFTTPVDAQVAPGICDDVRTMIDRQIVPYELNTGGGVLETGEAESSILTPDKYADVWAVSVELLRSSDGTVLPNTIDVSINALSQGAAVEFAVFDGMDALDDSDGESGFRPGLIGQTRSFRVGVDGLYTIVVRHPSLVSMMDVTYQITATFDAGGAVTVPLLRDETINEVPENSAQLRGGLQQVRVNQMTARAHLTGISAIASRDGATSQVFLQQQSSILVNDWAAQLDLLGGDLSVFGTATDGRPRRLYVANFGYQENLLDPDLAEFTDSNGTTWQVDWTIVDGFWMTDDCAGIRLADGRSFVGTLDSASRLARFTGDTTDFDVVLSGGDGPDGLRRASFVWDGVAADTEARFLDNIFSLELDGDRTFSVTAQTIDMTLSPGADDAPSVDALLDSSRQIALDWVNMRAFTLRPDGVFLTFDDGIRETTSRRSLGLVLFEALDDVIRIEYAGEDGTAGDQRLMLPAAEGFIEIITPAGLPTVEGRSLPDSPEYIPRALNNTGGECYAINTIQPEANCPPNGSINPANGNIWYAVTDQLAYGGLIDLALGRSYNSLHYSVDGPFGTGWSTRFRLDYDVPFDAERASRPITPEVAAAYPVGLDVTWAPRGLVTLITPSGSRHQFVSDEATFETGTLRAVTMPGWTLTRDDLRAGWTLQQRDGQFTMFDRAGRLTAYGVSGTDRLVRVQHPEPERADVTRLDDAPIIITDSAPDAPTRQLALYYDDAGRIVRSVLQDVTAGDDATCDAATCFETQYRYDARRLVGVTYADGSEATYTYDDIGRLIAHDDPRAPVHPAMRYSYDDDMVTATITPEGSEDVLWQSLSAPGVETTQTVPPVQTLLRALTDSYGRERVYNYRYEAGALRTPEQTFALIAISSPLEGVSAYDSLPEQFEWDGGLLVSQSARQTQDGAGRSSVLYGFTADAQLQVVERGYPAFSAEHETNDGINLPTRLDFADGTFETRTYDEAGRVLTRVDRNGASYRMTYANGLVASVVNESDGTITAYTYNDLGLPETVSKGRVGDAEALAYTMTYEHDAFGRLTRVRDPLTSGQSITYESDPTGLRVIVTDATGTVTTTVYDTQGRRTAEITTFGDETLRHTEYEYDALNRLIAVRRRLDPLPDLVLFDAAIGDETDESPRFLETTFVYHDQAELAPLPGGDTPTIIRGYGVIETDAYGRETRTVYDALDRPREHTTLDGRIMRYAYDVRPPTEGGQGGLQIRETTVLGGAIINETTYNFDTAWQLQSVARGDDLWRFVPEFGTTRPSVLEMRQNDSVVLTQQWAEYSGGRATAATSTHQNPVLNSGTQAPDVTWQATFDPQGRPLALAENDTTSGLIAYCAEAGGALRTVYALPDREEIDCESTAFARAVTQDARGRVVQVETTDGSRVTTYTPDPETGTWQVAVAFESGDSWALVYNGVGDLVAWTDEAGFTRTYRYDTLGRLVRVAVDAMPDASFTFTYNDANQVTLAQDDLGRGTRYDYDASGRLIVEADARNANATTYGYNSDGLLASVISPLGNTTAFSYELIDGRAQLSSITEPTGAAVDFAWEPEANRLTFTDPRGNQTSYTFDIFGQLWRVDDALGRSHELHHGDGGLTSWRLAQIVDAGAASQVDLLRPRADTLQLESRGDGISWGRTFRTSPDGLLAAVDTLTFDFDGLARLSQVTAGDQTWALAFANDAATVTVTAPDGTMTEIGYDALNRLVSEARADGSATTYTYEASGGSLLTLTMDGATRQQVVYSPGDATSQPVSIQVRTSGGIRTYAYDAEGRLLEIVSETCIDAAALEEVDAVTSDQCLRQGDAVWRIGNRVSYDASGRPVRIVDPEQNVETLSYDDAGNLVGYQDVNGVTFNYAYDALNRLTSLTGPTGIRLLLAYDAFGQVSGICRARAETAATYAECASVPERVLETYTSDSLGRLIERRVPRAIDDAYITRFAYDERGLPTAWGQGAAADSSPALVVEHDSTGLDLPQALTIDGDSLPVTLDIGTVGLRLSQLAAQTWAFDGYGRLIAADGGERSLAYTYPDDLGSLVFSETTSGDSLAYTQDARGLLTTVGDALAIDYFLNPDGRIMVADMLRSDGENVLLTLNHIKQTQNITYFMTELTADHTLDAAGLVQRMSVVGLPDFFVGTASDYIIVIGYDSDGRPLTMRVTDRRSSGLLYLLNFTHNAFGQRETESRRFADGTQIDITYTYNTDAQLVRRVHTTNRPGNGGASSGAVGAAGAIILLMGMAGAPVISRRRRNRIIAFCAGLVLALSLTLTLAQPSSETVVFTYNYDTNGNLTAVVAGESLCATYDYDPLNRLRTVRDGNGDGVQQYAYDPLNRVIATRNSDLLYHGGAPTLAASVDEDGVRLRGQIVGLPEFFQAGANGVTWVVNDGRATVLAATDDGQTSGPIWLFDPVGRTIDLAGPLDNPCSNVAAPGALPPELAALAPFQMLEPGMLWDATTNLYLKDGRAYAPEIGIYLQRDPLGPDLYGNVQGYPARQIDVPVRHREPAYYEGITRLAEALASFDRVASLDADGVKAQVLPGAPEAFDAPFEPLLNAAARIDSMQMAQATALFDLPAWLMRAYNLGGADVLADGRLVLPDDTLPGLGRRCTPMTMTDLRPDPRADWLPEIAPPLERLQDSVAYGGAQNGDIALYVAEAWRPALRPFAIACDLPDASPASLLDWLPLTEPAVMQATASLDAIRAIDAMRGRRGADWVLRAFDLTLPASLDLPPDTLDTSLSDWLRPDALGIATMIEAAQVDLPEVASPIGGLGVDVP